MLAYIYCKQSHSNVSLATALTWVLSATYDLFITKTFYLLDKEITAATFS